MSTIRENHVGIESGAAGPHTRRASACTAFVRRSKSDSSPTNTCFSGPVTSVVQPRRTITAELGTGKPFRSANASHAPRSSPAVESKASLCLIVSARSFRAARVCIAASSVRVASAATDASRATSAASATCRASSAVSAAASRSRAACPGARPTQAPLAFAAALLGFFPAEGRLGVVAGDAAAPSLLRVPSPRPGEVGGCGGPEAVAGGRPCDRFEDVQ